MTIDFDPIERSSPELMRLRRKLEKLSDWLDARDTIDERTEQWQHRETVWMTTLAKYESLYDQTMRAMQRQSSLSI